MTPLEVALQEPIIDRPGRDETSGHGDEQAPTPIARPIVSPIMHPVRQWSVASAASRSELPLPPW
jgi:hypothetical protein